MQVRDLLGGLKINNMIDWKKITDKEEVIKLLKQRKKIEDQIKAIDKMALIKYEWELLQK